MNKQAINQLSKEKSRNNEFLKELVTKIKSGEIPITKLREIVRKYERHELYYDNN